MTDMLPEAILASAVTDAAAAEETPMEVDDGLSSNAKERSTLALPGAPRGPRGKESTTGVVSGGGRSAHHSRAGAAHRPWSGRAAAGEELSGEAAEQSGVGAGAQRWCRGAERRRGCA